MKEKSIFLLFLVSFLTFSGAKTFSLDKTIQRLRRNDETLTTLNLGRNRIGTTLNLGRNRIGDEGAIALAEALKINNTLTTLRLSYNNIGPEGAIALAEALKENSSLTNLYLKNNWIKNAGVIALAEALKENKTLTTLDLKSNIILDEGAIALAEALKENRTLTTLDLESNSIRDEGAIALAEALKENSSLTNLYLKNSWINNAGAIALAEALKENRTLTTLDLGRNRIGDEGAIALAEALKENRTLTTLDLASNNIGPEGSKALAEALKINYTLTTLNLYFTGMGRENSDRITFFEERNSKITELNLDLLNSFKKEHLNDIEINKIKFNRYFIKQRLNINSLNKLKNISEKDLEALIKWAYSNIPYSIKNREVQSILNKNQIQPKYYPDLFNKLYNIRNNENEGNVLKITLAGKTIDKIHKFLLYSRSKTIRNMYKDVSSDEDEIPVVDDRYPKYIVNIFIHFLYTDRIDIPENVLTRIMTNNKFMPNFYYLFDLADFFELSKQTLKRLQKLIKEKSEYLIRQRRLFEYLIRQRRLFLETSKLKELKNKRPWWDLAGKRYDKIKKRQQEIQKIFR